MTRLLWIMGSLAGALFIALFVMGQRFLSPGEFSIFDVQFGGYSVEYARGYLEALEKAGATSFYQGTFRQVDTIFPILTAMTLVGFIWHHARGAGIVLRVAIALCPLIYLALDLAENAAVGHLLRVGPQVSAGAILQASAFTVAKWISLALAMLLAIWAWRLAPKAGPGA